MKNILGRVQTKALLGVFKCKRIVARWYGTRVLDYSKQVIRIGTTTFREYDTRARSVYKEPETVAWIEQESTKGGVFYDVGANIGAYSFIAATQGLAVVAFEPAPQNFAALHENISLNGLDEKITAVPMVLGTEGGVHSFSFADYTRGATEGFFSTQHERAVKKSLLVETLDGIIRTYHLPPPSLMKIDVDGGEHEVLAGARETLAFPGLRSILIEVEEENREQVDVVLTAAGFTLSSFHGRRRAEMANLIYTRA